MLKEFKEFAVKGNAVDMAVGIIIGAAFGAVVSSLVADLIMPVAGLLLGNVDFSNLYLLLKEGTKPGPYLSLSDAKAVGAVTMNYGLFINKIVSFLIVGFSVFLLVKSINRLKKSETPPPDVAPRTKECPYCLSVIPFMAVRCGHCTSEVK